MSFMSTAPRPHSIPVLHDAAEGIDAPVLGDGRNHVEVAVQDEGGLVAVAAGHADAQVRASRDGLVVLGTQAERLEVGAHVLSGLSLPVRAPLAEVGGVEADQVARDAGDLGQFGGGHASTLALPMPRSESGGHVWR